MTTLEKDWNQEEGRLETVKKKIGMQIGQESAVVDQHKTNVTGTRQYFWSDITINLDNDDDLMETYTSITQQQMVLEGQQRSLYHAQNLLHRLTKLKESPYFGRIDFSEEGIDGIEQIYIGISSFLDEASEQYLIYDWRAPISNLFYDYPTGPAKYTTPMGPVDGIIELKRQYIIKHGFLKYMFDTGVAIGDEVLQQILSKNADETMKSIVATIQKEQNQIIRNDSHHMLIVQGAAGSGKTSVALQRVAYLLYKHRDTLHADNMILFSPNPMFNSYVSTVLPELGEANMQQTTFHEYLEYRLGDQYSLEHPFAQLEYVLTSEDAPEYTARISGIQYKASTDFFRLINNYKSLLEREGMIFKDLIFGGRVLISWKTMSQQFYGYDSSIRLSNRVVLLKKWMLKELALLEKKEIHQQWVQDEIELLGKDELQEAHEHLRRQRTYGTDASFDDDEKERLLLSRMVVRQRFELLREKVRQLSFVHAPAVYKQLFQDKQWFTKASSDDTVPPKLWDDIREQTVRRLDRLELAYEDATPLLYLQEMIEGFQTNTAVRHVIIDEAQDYSPFQYEFLKKLFPRSKMTLLGDLNQAVYAHSSNLSNYDTMTKLFGEQQTMMVRLTKSYRSTREIVDFTRGMLPGGEAIEAFNRSGDKPKVMAVSDSDLLAKAIMEDIKALKKTGAQSIAIICKTAQESLDAYARLKGCTANLHLVTKETHTFITGTLVIPSYLAKGLEFDAVIIYNGSKQQYSRESGRKLFYTACTRAMHHLHIYYIEDLTPFIAKLKNDIYVHAGN